MKDLEAVSTRVYQHLAAQKQGGGEAAAEAPKVDDDVIDAEIVDEDKK